MEIELRKLTKEFQKTKAVDNITLTLNNGVYGLLGANGAGKTTLMRMLCTLLKPTSGEILCNGKDIFEMDGGYRKRAGGHSKGTGTEKRMGRGADRRKDTKGHREKRRNFQHTGGAVGGFPAE
ncbi:hypothetical protein BRYFOR_09022 [Marvinbryantia formatexigens DSM 14469]|uniref:ABC transporter domain-containing protein n=1 Tax=Marvinbryantia formatexigens DSM 14469 TaxID=478749 RepID=C6LK35_9FIRM|nr:hypothetical protein BRYFOR_09022 [Marvinbryantia formatexigens DSM 14469]